MEKIIKELESYYEKLDHQEDLAIMNRVQQEVSGMLNEEINRRVKNRQAAGETDLDRINEEVHNEYVRDPEGFLGLTEEIKDKISMHCQKQIRKEKPELYNNIHNLRGLIDYLKFEEARAFYELDEVSEAFQYINLHVNTQIAIFMYIMRINHKLDMGPDEPTYVADAEALLDFEYKYIKTEELRKILEEQRLDDFFEDKSLKYRKARKEVAKRYEETKRDLTSRQQASNILGAIFEKEAKDTTEEDYQTIIEKMDELFFGHISHRLVKKIKKQKELELNPPVKQEKNVENKTEVNDTSKDKKKKPKETPKKQTSINQTIREINKYFELDTCELKEELSLDQIIYVLSLMYSINVEKNKVEAFLRNTMREFKNLHPYAIYNQGYDKFSYLGGDNPEVKEHLDMIEYILSDVDIFICDDATYKSTKELVEEEISEIMRIINGNYTYEEKEAKKLLKENEE